ncbi:AMP-binding protein [Cupriavidus oxalaticus]|uniref:AMP-binding protein n=1 Tax=Cupriavidus oxalaticus TaxID=96344 RepID=A0A375FSG8_9BURK|nr:AMP-binding protein [Cupriavidus oxalaticus]QRQ85237.1 AMP-binding protein [Cupriavidus oxalaticus]QRQ90675.1 AMP-binding protein [Cupriavidus oxalaticus]WQD85201.1 AMP-binding protein [Cupriavidus oxalaticus]SPC10094.1 Acetate/butyrate--CoA ligase AAE7, peroxisomal [Cupriavidus oxalaticus]SPC23539.1 Acyl-CoA synthetase [Cupriavidus oxalaticus]
MLTKYDQGLDKCQANFQPLTPLHFLKRAADVFPERAAVIYQDRRYTWRQYAQRCEALARALIAAGIERGDTVSILAPNVPEMLEAHFGVPLSGAVLNSINIRLDAPAIAFILQHSETRLLLVDTQFAAVAREAVRQSGREIQVVDIIDPSSGCDERLGAIDYDAFLETAAPDTALRYPADEWDAIALNYTSGTTGNPKGVVYHHRGAYLNALGQSINAEMPGSNPVYLWTLPLFHCNGWCFAWAMAAMGGTSICLRKVMAGDIYAAIEAHGVTHFGCAPTVLDFLVDGTPASWVKPARPIRIMCAGASPPTAVLRKVSALGFSLLHVYGMTEMHGVNTLCQLQPEWREEGEDGFFAHLSRQGVRSVVMEDMVVVDPSFAPVPRDGHTMGEVMFRGNLAMKGYLKNPEATAEAFAGGWYHSGDLAVVHGDGYIEIKDRAKDIIISGGENISSLEVEEVLYTHPAIQTAAVVAVPDAKWGEVPCALLELKPQFAGALSAEEVIRYCRERLPGFKTPRHIVFETLPRTATGKLQKFVLRKLAAAAVSSRT